MLLTVAGVACCIVSSSFHVTLPSPHTANKAMLSLQIKGNFLIKFEIGAGQCRLLHPADESLRPLREKALPPMELLRRLLHYGINLIPSDLDAAEIRYGTLQCSDAGFGLLRAQCLLLESFIAH